MKKLIKKKLRLLTENTIDGQKMNKFTEIICNKMSVKSYHEVIGLLKLALGPEEKNKDIWDKIKEPLDKLKNANIDLANQKNKYNMTGDSVSDEANTWWSAIQTVVCEQGSEFQ